MKLTFAARPDGTRCYYFCSKFFKAAKQRTHGSSICMFTVNLFPRKAVCFIMFRSLLFLILAFLMAATALSGGLYGSNAVKLYVPSSQAAATGIDCLKLSGSGAESSNNQACSSGKLCAVCMHAAFLADVGPAALMFTATCMPPAHQATAWLSAEHAPHFKPPIL